MEKISLKHIADELGVSIATVSLVLNGKNVKNRVSEEMSKKILKKAEELHYTPNTFAKGLKIGKSKTIGLIVADISNVFFGKLALYIQNEAEKEGYAVIIANTNEEYSEMDKMVRLLKSRQVDGLIITPPAGSEKTIQYLSKEKMPLVLVDRNFPELNVSSVMINNFEISYNAISKLIEKGFKNIALITYKQTQFHITERNRGYIEANKNANLYNEKNIKMVSYEFLNSDMETVINELLSEERPIDAIYFTTNSISISGIKELYKQKQYQSNIQLMCFDESDAFYILPLNIPFIKQPIKEMAKNAMQLLTDQMEMKNNEIKNCIVEAELKVRE
ncbi:MAG: LacI family DNA-binding transcriptional regulator [Dysgonamonadaceae bacterium]|jgi:LacI family transcriptional regulator|nr:LacI family DNA-binding transcriptional regulator [Dysgonamonadaceae bacterium]MEA5081563.1 LacI family DNA-binding transcriptional regulator [Dysgonamonadaceae bacterium]